MKKISLIVLAVFVIGLFASCVTTSSIGGTAETHGWISSIMAGSKAAADGATEIASYGIILGIVDTGYEAYVTAVKAAEAQGKKISSITLNYFFFYMKIIAYAK